MKISLAIASALAVAASLAPASSAEVFADRFDGPPLPNGRNSDRPDSESSLDSFEGSCRTTGRLKSATEAGDRVLQFGTCKGELNGAPSRSYPVKIVTRTSGARAGDVPLMLDGTGKTKFRGRGVSFRWRIRQTGTVYSIYGAEGTSGYGIVVPSIEGTYRAYTQFPNGIKG